MDTGAKQKDSKEKLTKGTMQWIKNQDMESMNGKMDGYIKVNSKMITGMVMASCLITKISWFIRDSGKMDRNQEDRVFMRNLIQILNKHKIL